MTSKQKGPGSGLTPSPVACRASREAAPGVSPDAPQEPVPGLLAYLESQHEMYLTLVQGNVTRAADKRASRHTKAQYERSAKSCQAMADKLAGFIKTYHQLPHKPHLAYATYEEWERTQQFSPVSPEAYHAERAWRAARELKQ